MHRISGMTNRMHTLNIIVIWSKNDFASDSLLDITLPTKFCLIKAMDFPVVMYGCESWTKSRVPKNRRFSTVVLGKTLESPLNSNETNPANPKGNQPRIFIGRTNAEAPILWPSDVKSWLIWKDPDVGKDWRHEVNGMAEDKMVGRHHWLNGNEFEWREIVKDRKTWHAAVHGVTRSRTWLSNWTN